MNEATFESGVAEVLRGVLPALKDVKIEVQRVLTLRLGHKDIQIDAQKAERLQGRFDVLVHVDGKGLMLLELKKPGLQISDDDRDQGISYARLLEPMPPLTVVSDGTDVRVFRTYDRSEIDSSDVDAGLLKTIVADGLAVAASDLDDAVARLLGRDAMVCGRGRERARLR